jgi:4-hydroxy-2-oxoglutarate aldolase
MKTEIKGVFAALTTPFKEDRIYLDKFAENIRKYNNFDLAGYVIGGSTGEGVYLTGDEILSLARVAKDTAAPGRKLIVGTARESTTNTLALTNQAADLGVDAALIVLPHYYKSLMHSEALKKHYLTIAENTKVPVIIYSIPRNTGITPDPELIIELSQHPNILGVKDSSGNLSLLEEAYPRMASGSTFLLGAGGLLLTGLSMGVGGGILTLAAVAPDLCAQLYRLHCDNKQDEAKKLQLDLIPLNQAVTKDYGVPGAKCALDLRGYYGGPCRLPLLPVDEKERIVIQNLLTELDLL